LFLKYSQSSYSWPSIIHSPDWEPSSFVLIFDSPPCSMQNVAAGFAIATGTVCEFSSSDCDLKQNKARVVITAKVNIIASVIKKSLLFFILFIVYCFL